MDELLAKHGGTRLVPLGKSDVASGDPFTEFDTWEEKYFWPAMTSKYATKSISPADSAKAADLGLKVTVSSPRPSTLHLDVKRAEVTEVRVLSAPGAPEKRHIEIQLPSDLTYSAGDYLAILPQNPRENVQRAMRRFGLAWDCVFTITHSNQVPLPVNTPISANDVLSSYLELAQPATKRVSHKVATVTLSDPIH